jgi:magnesium-transporting ATPase (P-type)
MKDEQDDDDVFTIPFDEYTTQELASKFVLCVTGDSLEGLRNLDQLHNKETSSSASSSLLDLVKHVSIYARVAPHHKVLFSHTYMFVHVGTIYLICF